MSEKEKLEIRDYVRKSYASIASSAGASCCAPEQEQTPVAPATLCCSPETGLSPEQMSKSIGYSAKDIKDAPEGANLGLGCGNPQVIASLKEGEVVVDLGSGAGFDAFLAARAVGQSGRVVGVDMTHEMLAKARNNATDAGFTNVEFRLGEIEHLPIADNFADVIISNCVINLSPDKKKVLNEAFRVLRSGGRMAIADVVALKELPAWITDNMAHYSGCLSGASQIGDMKEMLKQAGFADIKITTVEGIEKTLEESMPGSDVGQFLTSAYIEATKAL